MFEGELELEAELEDLMNVLLESDLESEAEMFAPAATGPIFDLACTGCADNQCVNCPDASCAPCPLPNGDCHGVLRNAIVQAVTLARDAAAKIDSAIGVPPDHRNGAQQNTALIFHLSFCHDPSAFIPWAHGPSGASIAERFRAVARELDGGRKIHFLCRPTSNTCAPTDDKCCGPNDFAFRMPRNNTTLFLCNDFWTENELRRAGTIIHETLHLLFGEGPESGRGGIHGILDADPSRANAHCYKAFVLRLNGFHGDDASFGNCAAC